MENLTLKNILAGFIVVVTEIILIIFMYLIVIHNEILSMILGTIALILVFLSCIFLMALIIPTFFYGAIIKFLEKQG